MKTLFPILLVPFVAGVSISAIAATSDVPISFAERGLPLPISRKGTTINVTTGKISHIAISDKSCVVYTQIQNSIYLKSINPCLKFDGVFPDTNPTLRAWVDSKILEFRICSRCSGARNINIVGDRTLEPIVTKVSKRKTIPVPALAPISKVPTEIPAPPPQENPSVVSEVPPLVQEEPSPTPKYKLLKPIPQVVVPISKEVKPTRKKANKVRIKIEQKAPQQDNLSPSQRALMELGSQPKTDSLSKEESKQEDKAEIFKVPETPKLEPKTKTFKLALGQSQAKALLKGLNIARIQKGKDRVAYRSQDWMVVQDVIYFLKINKPLDVAIKKARASKPLIERLLRIGGTAGV